MICTRGQSTNDWDPGGRPNILLLSRLLGAVKYGNNLISFICNKYACLMVTGI